MIWWIVLASIGVILVCLEVFWIRQSRKNLIEQQEGEWLSTRASIQATLSDPVRQQSVAEAMFRSVSNKALLDQVCESTANALSAPAAVITVVEHEGQRWLAYYGADWCSEDVRQGLLEPLETSYCQYVVVSDETLVILDSFTDIRVRTNSQDTRRTVRAYIGAPVHTADGHVIGSLCVFDQNPRKWTTRDRVVVESFASLVRL